MVKRYDSMNSVSEYEDGYYVTYSDYQKLEQVIEEILDHPDMPESVKWYLLAKGMQEAVENKDG